MRAERSELRISERLGADDIELSQPEGVRYTVEEHSTVLKKELGLRDLVLAQILIVVTYNFIGTAGKLGSHHLVYWLIAIVTFYIPLGMVVSSLNSLMPLEGGIYQWAKLGFNRFMGFVVAWNMWLYVIVYLSSIGLEVSTYLSFALPDIAWIATNKLWIILANCCIIGFLVYSSVIELHIGKVVFNLGAALSMGVFSLLIFLPLLNIMGGNLVPYQPIALTMPGFSLLSCNILTKMAFGGLCGFEHVAVFAGESKNPARSIRHSIIVAAPIIAMMYILGTSSVLAFHHPDNINLIGPVPQALQRGLEYFQGTTAWAVALSPILIICLALSQISYGSILLAGMSRLPMVAGWDSLLPQWFSRLHPKYKTPVNSVLFVGCITMVIGCVSMLGVGEQEAFQMVVNASFIFYALTYLIMFAIPLIGKRGIHNHFSLPVKIAACCGGAMSLGFIVLALFPIVEVENPWVFGGKILGVMVISNSLGAALYVLARKKKFGQKTLFHSTEIQ